MKCPISACMIVRNEAVHIIHSIPALLPYVEEVIVADTGSTDDTISLARSFGARVFEHPWKDDFSEARNRALAAVTQPYVLVVDADECLVKASVPALQAYCAAVPSLPGTVQIRNLSDDPDAAVTITVLPRLFPARSGYHYAGRIHEQLRWNGEVPALIETGVVLDHQGYTQASIQKGNKVARNIRLLEREAQERPDDPYVQFQLAKTLYVGRQFERAAAAFQQVIDTISQHPGLQPAFLPTLLVQYAYSLLHLREFGALFQVVEAGIELYPDLTHLYFVYGQALIELKDPARFHEVRSVFESCLQLGDPPPGKYETVHGVGSFMAEYNLGVYYEVTGDLARAQQYYKNSAEAGYPLAIKRLATLN